MFLFATFTGGWKVKSTTHAMEAQCAAIIHKTVRVSLYFACLRVLKYFK